MKRLYLVMLVGLLAYGGLLWAEPILRMNTTGQPPLNTAAQDGFMDEVAAAAFRRIGYPLQTIRLPAERGLKNANRGLIDGEMSRVAGLERYYLNLIRVPEKIMDWEFVVFSYKPVELHQGWAGLSGKSVAHVNGWKILEKNLPVTTEVTKTSSAEQLFNLLRKRRTDYVLYERWGGRYLLRDLDMNDVQLRSPPLAVKEMFIYLHNRHQALVPKLSAALVAMKKDGSYAQLEKKHLLPLK
ncbi:substrate-binding periplasmic protein [Sulfuriflexus mobilis]|uniref:substrate-binding periplasmic protein n=1 Tax=Sulfuriflexus mobilis TaxID=1811807 RepID=UPI000F831CB2|nr:transporter substrate-binding domain-containing protein [Sulfuriflexus mobilis]